MGQGLQGMTVGRYQLGRQIGEDRFVDVYLAEDTHRRIGRQIAIKMIPLPSNEDDVELALKFFDREVKAITTLNHPHILPVFDYDVAQWHTAKFAYLVMPYCE